MISSLMLQVSESTNIGTVEESAKLAHSINVRPIVSLRNTSYTRVHARDKNKHTWNAFKNARHEELIEKVKVLKTEEGVKNFACSLCRPPTGLGNFVTSMANTKINKTISNNNTRLRWHGLIIGWLSRNRCRSSSLLLLLECGFLFLKHHR